MSVITRFSKSIRLMLSLLCSASLLLFTSFSHVHAQDFKTERLVSGLGIPWGLAQLPDGSLLITERSGTLKHYSPRNNTLNTISGLPEIYAFGQGGLLDVALSPHYERDATVYFTYVKNVNETGRTTLASALFKEGLLSRWQDLLVTDSGTGSGRHFGSRIAFDYAGHVFFSVGDRGEREAAQDRRNHIGTIIRLKLDGSVPEDNPFIDNPTIRDEIWSYGHRNPQGMAYDTRHKRLWSIEHGPRGGDEINLIKAGANYGWPVISYGKEYWGPISVGEGTHREGMEQPQKVYVPSIAPGSLLIYDGEAFPDWRGSLFAGALKLRHLNRVALDLDGKVQTEHRLLEDRGERIRAILESREGWIYFSTDQGEIHVIKPVR